MTTLLINETPMDIEIGETNEHLYYLYDLKTR